MSTPGLEIIMGNIMHCAEDFIRCDVVLIIICGNGVKDTAGEPVCFEELLKLFIAQALLLTI